MASPSSFKNTPEASQSGLRRKDSKHALSTCHGLTASGKACRRPLAAKDHKTAARYTISGSLVLPHSDQDPAVFFCWQHKDQADLMNMSSEAKIVNVKERTSLETVFKNLGLEEVEEDEEEPEMIQTPSKLPQTTRQSRQHEVRRKGIGSSRPENGQQHQIRRKDVSNVRHERQPPRVSNRQSQSSREPTTKSKSSKNQNRSGLMSSLFGCFAPPDLNSQAPARPRHRTSEFGRRPERSFDTPKVNTSASHERRPPHKDGNRTPTRHVYPRVSVDEDSRRDSLSPRKSPGMKVYQDPLLTPPHAPSYHRTPLSQPDIRRPLVQRKSMNNRAKSTPGPAEMSQEWMPQAPPNPTDAVRLTYAKLLTAMSERPTKADDSGYIYMFWQSDLEQTADEEDAAASIVGAPSYSEADSEQILQNRFFRKKSISAPTAEQRTLFLKIGRAENVHRRMSQWQKQCKYNVSLLRYYPMESKGDVTQVPYVGKVERLVHLHLEMLGQRVKRPCRCGTEHKEWFEIEATAKAVREVDEIIRQWVQWSIWKYGDEIL